MRRMRDLVTGFINVSILRDSIASLYESASLCIKAFNALKLNKGLDLLLKVAQTVRKTQRGEKFCISLVGFSVAG